MDHAAQRSASAPDGQKAEGTGDATLKRGAGHIQDTPFQVNRTSTSPATATRSQARAEAQVGGDHWC
jgi:hypothetical protein